jgi:LPXTG-motif cell wall-anchored protein
MYWGAMFAAWLVVSVPASFPRTGDSPATFLTFIGFLASLAIFLTASVRRLQDRGKDGPTWLGLFLLLPVVLFWVSGHTPVGSAYFIFSGAALSIAAWMFVELGFFPGTTGENKFGPDPRDKSRIRHYLGMTGRTPHNQ